MAVHGATADKALTTIVSVFSIIVHMGLNRLPSMLLGRPLISSMTPSVGRPEVNVEIFHPYFADVK